MTRPIPPRLHAALLACEATPAGAAYFANARATARELESLENFESLPVIPREELADYQRLSPDYAGFAASPLRSSGRTLGLHPGGELDPGYAGGRKGTEHVRLLFEALGVTKRDVFVNTLNYHMSSVAHVIDAAVRQIGATVVPTGPGNTALQVDIVKHLRPTVLFAFPSFARSVLEACHQARVSNSIRLAICGGEKAPGLRAILKRDFGVETIEFYGISVVGPIAHECSARRGLHLLANVYVELVDVENGLPSTDTVGEIVVTPLDGDYIVPRVGTGDLATWLNESCSCGSGARRLREIVGRVGKSVKVRGLFVHPRDLERLVGQLPGVTACRVVVRRDEATRDQLSVECVVDMQESENASELEKRITEAFTSLCRLRPDVVEVTPGRMRDRTARVSIQDERRIVGSNCSVGAADE